MHVPKTAGSTLKWVIQRQYPTDRTVVVEGENIARDYRGFRELPLEKRERLLCVIGHIPYGIDQWLPQGARYVTMLRHPVAWTLSFHAFIRRMPFFENNPELAAFRGAGGLDLDGFLNFLRRSNMHDMQTRAVSGHLDVLNLLPPYPPLRADALDVARQRLRESFACVGIVERFDESLLLMKRKLGWGKIHYRRLNVGESRHVNTHLSAADLERILDCHRHDAALYEEAVRLLDAEIESAGDEFQLQLERFRIKNSVFNRLLPAYEALGLPRMRERARRFFQA